MCCLQDRRRTAALRDSPTAVLRSLPSSEHGRLAQSSGPSTQISSNSFCVWEGSNQGVAKAMPRIRWERRTGILVQDQDLIPPTAKFHAGLCCSQAHPGLCLTKDSAVYADALRLARNIERCFTAADLGSFSSCSEGEAQDPWGRGGVVYVTYHKHLARRLCDHEVLVCACKP